MSASFERYLRSELTILSYDEMLPIRALACSVRQGDDLCLDAILQLPSPLKEDAFVLDSLRRFPSD